MEQNEKKLTDKKRLTKSWIVYISIAVLTVLLNVVAWNSNAFCDAYIKYIFPIWVNTYGRLTGMFPFSVGEWLIVAGVLLVGLAVLLGVACAVTGIVRLISHLLVRLKARKTPEGATLDNSMNVNNDLLSGTKASHDKLSLGHGLFVNCVASFYCFFAWTVLIVCVIMTLNCTILYHASTFSENYFGEETGDYTFEQFVNLYNFVASECNRLSAEMVRDEEGRIVYTRNADAGAETAAVAGTEHGDNVEFGAADTESGANKRTEALRNQMADEAIACMQKLGETYPQLDGWYPRPKPMMFSDLMCQQYMCGYYFPFSMEANYNDVMYIMNKPATFCHELAHLRGYIFEDEANFIAYLACLESEDPVFQYAGYLSVINYLTNDLYKAYQDEKELFIETVEKTGLVAPEEQVSLDNIFVEDHEWDRINDKAVVDTETVEEVSDTFTNATLKLNGVSDGMVSYSRVVRLLLQYYAYMGVI